MQARLIIKTISIIILAAVSTNAQHLNQYGHIVSSTNDKIAYKVNPTSTGSKIDMDHLRLDGNSVFKTSDGFVTLSGNYENAPSILRLYSKEGKEIFTRTFAQTINFVLSPSANFCAFFDMKQIHLINIKTHKVTSYDGSSVFDVNDAGALAYYDEKASTINFKGSAVKIQKAIYKILFFKEDPLFISMTDILLLKNGLPETVFTTTEGRVFDAAAIENKLYVSVKREEASSFHFSAFSAENLPEFIAGEEVQFPLQSHLHKIHETTIVGEHMHHTRSRSNETILNPLHYYSDTVYQQVGNSYCEIQEYSPGAMYPHPGVDLLDTFMQDVYSVKKGFVKAILTTSGQYHWRIAISNKNTADYTQGYLYAHLVKTSFSYAVGDSVDAGDVIGHLANFPVDGFVHCHFARIGDEGSTWNGSWWTFDNPLTYMTNFFDTIAPEFEKTIQNDVFAFRDTEGNYLSPDSLYGDVKVISKVFDRINSKWHCDVHELRYSVSPLAFPEVMLLDSFAYAYDFYNDDYFNGSYYRGLLRTIYSRDENCFSTANYVDREFYHIVTNSDGNDTIDAADSLQVFNTFNFPNDSYIFRVTASDPSGNTSSDSMIVTIKNGFSGYHETDLTGHISLFPNPFSFSTTILLPNTITNATLTMYNTHGQVVKQINNISGPTIDVYRDNLASGLYYIRLSSGNKMITMDKFVILD